MQPDDTPPSANAFYDIFWKDKCADHSTVVNNQRWMEIKQLLTRFSPPRHTGCIPSIVDVGCGVGWLSSELTTFGDVTGVDSSSYAISYAKQHFPGARYLCLDLQNADSTSALGAYDIAVCSEVVEHIPHQEQPAFSNLLARLVRQDGLLLITTPNRHVWNAYWATPESHQWKQSIEAWRTPAELTTLLRPHFDCELIYTFDFTFTRRGLHRLVNSTKVNAALRSLKLKPWLDWVKRKRLGLFIVGAFRRKGTERSFIT